MQRWAFVQVEFLKNLAMGSKTVQSIRGSRTRHNSPKQALDAAAEKFNFYESQLQRLGSPTNLVREKRVLEIGPGASLIIPIWFLAKGAGHAAGLDRFMELLPPSELRASHELVVKMWPPEMRGLVEDLLSWSPPGNPGGRLRYWNVPIEVPPEDLAGSFDVVVSFNAMQHVSDVGAAMRSQYGLLVPGGLIIHRIDCGPHGSAGSFGIGLLNQLTFSPRVWRLMYSNRMGTNQEPMSIFIKECERAGFKDIAVEVMNSIAEEDVERRRPRLHPEYRSRSISDLRVNCFALTAIKP
jgi:SAM-dependent methyltransferase